MPWDWSQRSYSNYFCPPSLTDRISFTNYRIPLLTPPQFSYLARLRRLEVKVMCVLLNDRLNAGQCLYDAIEKTGLEPRACRAEWFEDVCDFTEGGEESTELLRCTFAMLNLGYTFCEIGEVVRFVRESFEDLAKRTAVDGQWLRLEVWEMTAAYSTTWPLRAGSRISSMASRRS